MNFIDPSSRLVTVQGASQGGMGGNTTGTHFMQSYGLSLLTQGTTWDEKVAGAILAGDGQNLQLPPVNGKSRHIDLAAYHTPPPDGRGKDMPFRALTMGDRIGLANGILQNNCGFAFRTWNPSSAEDVRKFDPALSPQSMGGKRGMPKSEPQEY